MSVDHASAVAAPKSDPIFLHVKPGDAVVITDSDGAWLMADVIWVDGGAGNPKVPTLFQVADVDTGVINWVNADLVTHSFRAAESGRRGRGNPLVFISQGAAVVQTRDSFLKRLNDGSHWELMPNWFLDRFAGLHRQVAREPKWVMRQWCL